MSYVLYITGRRPMDEYRRAYVPVIKDTHSRYARAFLSFFMKGQNYRREDDVLFLDNGDRIRCDKLDDLLPLMPNVDGYSVNPEDHQRILQFKYGTWEKATTMVHDAVITTPAMVERASRPQRPDGYVTITELCAASNVLPSDARAILRASGREKPEYGWAFAPDELKAIRQLCGIK